MLKIITSYAFRNIFRTRLRSFFTLFSITLIIMLYTVLTSIGDTFTEQISTALEHQDIDIAVQAKYASTPVSSIIDAQIVTTISEMPEVSAVYTLLIGNKRIEGKTSVMILGVSSFTAFEQRLGLSVTHGRGVGDGEHEVMVGEKIARVYGVSAGDMLALNGGQKYQIVGVYASWLNIFNSGIVANLSSVQKLVGKSGKASLLFLKLDEPTRATQVVSKINQLFPEMRAMASQQLPEYLGGVKKFFYFSKVVSFLTLTIAIAVLINTFIMAISERTKEIGILSAIGWPRMMIIAIFMSESLLLAVAGGVLGYLSSYPVMFVLQSNFTSISVYLPEVPTLGLFFNVLWMSVVIGMLSTIFPAIYGTRIEIARAVRHE